MKYIVLKKNVEKLQKKVNRIRNKGANVVFEVADKPTFIKSKKFEELYYEAYEVEAEGCYRIDGWQFVGTIEHLDSGNVIRLASSEFEGKVPERYRSCEPYCEHCNTHRNRKDTYLVHNESTGEFKMVGKQCLMSYTNGLDAAVCAELMSVVNGIDEEPNEDEIDDVEAMYLGGGSYAGNSIVKNVAYEVVTESGYVPSSTYIEISNKVFGPYMPINHEEIKDIDEWAKGVDANSEYMRNAKTMWFSKNPYECRDIALIASFINVYLKQKAIETAKAKRAKALANSGHVGEVGKRIEFEVESCRVLYTRSNAHCSYYASDSWVYEIVDSNGNVLVWSTSCDVEKGMRFSATVKSHGEYRGVKQTTITRGKRID